MSMCMFLSGTKNDIQNGIKKMLLKRRNQCLGTVLILYARRRCRQRIWCTFVHGFKKSARGVRMRSIRRMLDSQFFTFNLTHESTSGGFSDVLECIMLQCILALPGRLW